MTMNERITIRVTAHMKEALERFHRDQVVPARSSRTHIATSLKTG